MPRDDGRMNPKTWQRITDLAEDLTKDCSIEADGTMLTHGHALAELVANRAHTWKPGDFAQLIRKLREIKEMITWCKERDVERQARGTCHINVEIQLDRKQVHWNWV